MHCPAGFLKTQRSPGSGLLTPWAALLMELRFGGPCEGKTRAGTAAGALTPQKGISFSGHQSGTEGAVIDIGFTKVSRAYRLHWPGGPSGSSGAEGRGSELRL